MAPCAPQHKLHANLYEPVLRPVLSALIRQCVYRYAMAIAYMLRTTTELVPVYGNQYHRTVLEANLVPFLISCAARAFAVHKNFS
jgi:hypothetical protein